MQEFKHLTGLELARTMLDADGPVHEIMPGTMNFRAVSFEKGHSVFEGEPEQAHMNMAGRVHGGWALTILDTSMGSAVLSAQDPGRVSTTATMESKFMRPVAMNRTYRCEGFVISSGKTLAHARSELTDIESGKIVATATGTFAILTV